MARTAGRKPLPLPDSVRHELQTNGFMQMEGAEPRPWRHPWAPGVAIRVVASNIPGSTDVTISVAGVRPARVTADVAVAMIQLQAAQIRKA